MIYSNTGGSYTADFWFIVNVKENERILNTYIPVTLAYNVPTSVYFASASQGTFSPIATTVPSENLPAIAPVNPALVGQKGAIGTEHTVCFHSSSFLDLRRECKLLALECKSQCPSATPTAVQILERTVQKRCLKSYDLH